MPKKKTQLDSFADLTWNDLGEWAGSKIVSRGTNYQRQGRVGDLAVTEDDGLIAWVDGTEDSLLMSAKGCLDPSIFYCQI